MRRIAPGALLIALALALLALWPTGLAHAAADHSLVPTRADVPGLRSAGSGSKVARAALGNPRRLPAALGKATVRGAAFAAGGRRLDTGTFVLGSTKNARQGLAQAGRGFKGLKGVGDDARQRTRVGRRETEAIVLFRVLNAVAAVRMTIPGKSKAGASQAAQAYAGALATRLRRVLRLTEWERTLDAIRPDGTVPKDVALRAFAIAYGPLPGVRRPTRNVGTPPGATLAMQLVARVWDQLSQAQRNAIDRALGAPHDPSSPRIARSAAQVLTPDPGFQALADKYNGIFRARIPDAPPVVIRAFKASEDITAANGNKAYADALPVNAAGEWGVGSPAYCRVRVPPYGQAEVGKPFFELVMAHELFHCYQFVLMANWRQRSAWVIEGMADWAATSVYPTTQAIGGANYRNYLVTPTTSLLSRSYDSVGFWARADEVGTVGSLWPKLRAILGAATDTASFELAGATQPAFVSTWASATVRFPGAGASWYQTRPYAIPAIQLNPPLTPVTSGTTLGSSPYAMAMYGVERDSSRPLVNVLRLDGHLRAGSAGGDEGPIDSEWFCMGSKCECPPNRVSSIPAHRKYIRPVLTLALSGGAGPGAGRVTFHELDEFCKKKDKQPGPAESNGDPHMTSLDGLHFDFQAAGEFILARSASKDLEIQARQETIGSSRSVTVNTQFAMRVGGRRVTVSKPDDRVSPVEVRVDGTLDPLPAGTPRALPGGGTVTRTELGPVIVTWPDGSTFSIRSVGRYGVAGWIQLAAARENRVAGVLGDFDGSLANDLADRKGKRIRYTAVESDDWGDIRRGRVKEEFESRFTDALYDDFGEAWRISQAESLFDYGPGQSTRTFTRKDVPRRAVDPDELARSRRANAERICRARGVTLPGPLEDCILDLVMTGRAEFADDAAAAQEALEQASPVTWTKLRAGAALNGPMTSLRTPDGLLHLGIREYSGPGTDAMRSVPITPSGTEGAAEQIAAIDEAPGLFTGPDGGARAVSAELPSSAPSGVYQYARGPTGTWTKLNQVTTFGSSYASRPTAILAPDGTLITVSPMAGRARVFRGAPAAPNEGVELRAEAPDCYTTSPELARDGVSGAIWVAWLQWDCPDLGVYAQQIDPATGAPVGAPLKAPGSSWTEDGTARYPNLSLSDSLAFTGRPGQDGVFLAFPADPAGNVRLWRVGAGQSVVLAGRPLAGERERERAHSVRISAEPAGGRLWLAWREGARLWVARTASSGSPEGAPRGIDPPRDRPEALFRLPDHRISARSDGADLVYGVPRGDTPGGLWLARLTP